MPVPPELPVPKAAEVDVFRALFLKETSILLSEEEAFDQCRRLVQFVFLTQYAVLYLRKTEENGKNTE